MKRLLTAAALAALTFVDFAALTVATVAPAQAVVVVRRAPVARRAVVVRPPAVVVRPPVVVAPARRRAVIVR